MDINILISMFFVVILVMMIALIKYVWLHGQAEERYLTLLDDLEDLEFDIKKYEFKEQKRDDLILEQRTIIQEQERTLERMGGLGYKQLSSRI